MKLAPFPFNKAFGISKLPLHTSSQEEQHIQTSRKRGMAAVLSSLNRLLSSETKRFTSPNALNHYTSISVQGKYKERIEDEEDEEEEQTKAIKIKFGYSRDKRPDLKQFMLNMICSGDGGVPLFMQLGDGNESDKKVFPQIIKDCQETLNMESLSVMDGAFYTAENVGMARSIQWLSRVPLTLKEATETLENLSEEQWQSAEQDGYRWQAKESEYGGEEQRWLVVESVQRLQSDNQAIAHKIEKADKVVKKEWQKLCGQNFACDADALTQAQPGASIPDLSSTHSS